MEKQLLYKIYQDTHISYTDIPQPFDKSERYYRLTAGSGCHLKDLQTGATFKTVLIPEYQINYWVEESY